MTASTEPPAYCFGYGGAFSTSPFNMITNSLCKIETSLSPPSSPSSSHSSLSLEPLTSSPSSSASLVEAFSYNHLLSTSYIDIPTLLDTPSSSSSHYTSLSLSTAPSHCTRKRPAISELEGDSAQLEGSKRLCEMSALDGSRAQRGREYVNDEMLSSSHNSELIDGAIWRYGDAENAGLAGGDLDDMLDILLQEAEALPTIAEETILKSSPHSGNGSSGCTYKLHQCKEEAKEFINSKLSKIEEEEDCLASMAHPRKCESSDEFQDRMSWEQRGDTTASGSSGGGGAWQELGRGKEEKANTLSFCEELMKQIAPSCADQQQKQQKNCPSRGSTRSWAGPTLMDIESALAMTGSPPSPTSHYSPLSSPFGLPPPRSTYLCSIRDILKQETSPHLTSSPACKEEPLQVEEDDKMCTWRRLQKRNHMEPRYTVKIRCEEDAVNDGYRWRKYGQKSIKNSPYPRSYYRCSSGKCSVKKQVERCSEDAGLLVVTYEGIHLHHRPTSILTSNTTCASSPPTCDTSLAPPLPVASNNPNSSLLSHLLCTPQSHPSSPPHPSS